MPRFKVICAFTHVKSLSLGIKAHYELRNLQFQRLEANKVNFTIWENGLEGMKFHKCDSNNSKSR